LIEACLINGIGASIELPGDPFVALFSESSARAIVATDNADGLLELAGVNEVPVTVLGTTGGNELNIAEQFEISIAELRTASEATLPALFG
jgi:phosphoribosylformylglycinamidine synthase